MTQRRKKADNICAIGVISFIVALIFIAMLAASTIKMNASIQLLSAIFFIFFFATALVLIIIAMRYYDAERQLQNRSAKKISE